jgi:hypothetical protein
LTSGVVVVVGVVDDGGFQFFDYDYDYDYVQK